MNPTVLLYVVAAVLYVVIGVMSAVRSFGYLRQLNPAVARMPLVVAIVGFFEVLGWPVALLVYPPVGGQINALGANNALNQQTLTSADYTPTAANTSQFYTTPLVPS